MVDLADDYYDVCKWYSNEGRIFQAMDNVPWADEHFCVEGMVDSTVEHLQWLLWFDIVLGVCAMIVLGFGSWSGQAGEGGGDEKVRNACYKKLVSTIKPRVQLAG